MREKKYNCLTVGGTFDLLHKGHESLFEQAFKISKKVVIGITSDDYVKRKGKKGRLENYNKRKKGVEEFLKKAGWRQKGEIRKIKDMFGPLRERTEIEAMVVSQQTAESADKINVWRKKKGLKELDIIETAMVLAEDRRILSSCRIRAGEVNRQGVVWAENELWGRMPEGTVKRDLMREELRKPLGEMVERIEQVDFSDCLLITVGDVSTKRLLRAGIKPDLAVFDLKVRRKKVYRSPEKLGIDTADYKIIKIVNKAGTVSKDLFEYFTQRDTHVRGFLSKRYRIKGRKDGRNEKTDEGSRKKTALWIEGEEDLVVLPAILLAPLGAVVFYGQPPIRKKSSDFFRSRLEARGSNNIAEQGLVVVKTTEERKNYVFNILKEFEK